MADAAPPASDAPADDAPPQKHTRVYLVAGLLAVVLLTVAGYFWWEDAENPSTDDALIRSHYVWISAQVTGPVVTRHVVDNQVVKQGDPLFEIDPRPYQQAVDEAQDMLVVEQHKIEADKAAVKTAQALLDEHQAALDFAEKRYKEAEPLVPEGAVSGLQALQYEAAMMEARGRVAAAQAELDQAQVDLGSPEVQAARVAATRAKLELARIDLERTVVYAPTDGYVTNFELRIGDVVQPGQRLFPFIESELWWAHANFKETQLERIREGDPASVTIDIYGGHVFTGEVESLSRSSAASFSLLPAQNTTGNWVKVTQRVPVRVRMHDTDPERPFRNGVSATVTVHTRAGPKAAQARDP